VVLPPPELEVVNLATAQKPNTVPSLLAVWLQQLADNTGDTGIAWLDGARRNALDELFKSGRLPGRKDERWKYFSLQALEFTQPELSFGSAKSFATHAPLLQDTGALLLPIQVGNDWQIPEELQDSLPAGLRLLNLKQATSEPGLEAQLKDLVCGIDLQGPSRIFEALNTASLDCALIIHVTQGVDAGRLHLAWQQAVASQLDNFRVFVLLDENAKLQLLESHSAAIGGGAVAVALFNQLSQVQLSRGARLDHLRVQAASAGQHLLQFVQLDQAADSQYRYSGFELGGGLVRNDLHCRLNGSGASADLAAAFIGNGESIIDHHLVVDHHAPGCRSDQNFRGVLGGRSKGVFNGKALIRPGADGSSVRQSNANLLLSDLAEMNTKPELEIYADEVEASHGATVGQLDEQALFYLQTRGLAEDAARRMLTGAFCRAIGARLSDRQLVEQIETLMDRAMPEMETDNEIAA
jgi:Fe-S cluster assembly protein SufD